jgi:threonine efflux protein
LASGAIAKSGLEDSVGPALAGMMTLDSLTTYLLSVASLWAVATVSPGPNFLVISQLAASRSRLAAFAAACGCGIATIVWGVCGVAGVHAIFLAAPWAYLALKFAGAAYLLYCGISMILRSRRKAGAPAALSIRKDDVSLGKALALGVTVGLANPRSALSVASIFAVALPPQSSIGLGISAITIMVLISVCWYVLVAYMFSTGFVSQGYRRIGHFIDKIAGGLLVFLGLRLAVDSR